MAFAFTPEVPVDVAPPALVAPGPREVSYGRISGTVGAGIDRVVVYVDEKPTAELAIRGRRFTLRIALPARDATLRVEAHDALGNSGARSVEPVFGLPPAAAAAAAAAEPFQDARLAEGVEELVNRFEGISAVYVENLATGAGAAWNARARFPAASTVKLAIAVEVLRVQDARPPLDSELDTLLAAMLIDSDNEAANALLAWLGGSETSGAAQVNRTLAALELADSQLYGGFLVGSGSGPPIPLTVEDQPVFEGKYTTAWDLARLHRYVHLATAGRGPLVRSLGGTFTAADARYVLYLLAHSADTGKLDRYVPDGVVVPHKAGWITEARHDAGIVYAPGAAFVVSVMTWTGVEAGDASDELAGRVADLALRHFRSTEGEPEPAAAS
jgi:beta-lactamase class A